MALISINKRKILKVNKAAKYVFNSKLLTIIRLGMYHSSDKSGIVGMFLYLK